MYGIRDTEEPFRKAFMEKGYWLILAYIGVLAYIGLPRLVVLFLVLGFVLFADLFAVVVL